MLQEQVLELCTKEFLVPFESYAKKLSDGSCTAYPDPASQLFKMTKNQRDELTPEQYEDLGKPWTIGYGSTFDEFGKEIKPGDIWSHEKALKVKVFVLRKFYNSMLHLSPNLVVESIKRQAAILSWIYNLGVQNYEKSTFRKKINEKNWKEAATECEKWNKAKGKILNGLIRRRKFEADNILKG